MTDPSVRAARRRTSNSLNVSLSKLLALPESRINFLAASIRGNRVGLLATELVLPLGVSPARMASLRRDVDKFRANGNSRLATAQEALEEAERRLAVRRTAFRAWLMRAKMKTTWIDALVAALRHDVTYVRFMKTPSDKVGTLYVETSTE